MKSFIGVLQIPIMLMILLSACIPAATETPTELPTPMVFTTSAPTAVIVPSETPTSVPVSFEPAIYRDEAAGFEFHYPSSWTADPPQVGGDRGTIAQITSWSRAPGEFPESVPDGETILSISVLAWDPKYALDEFVAARIEGWTIAEYEILLEEKVTLAGEQEAYRFVIQTPWGQDFYLITTAGDRYLLLSGSGDLEVLGETAGTLRSIENVP